MKHHEKDRRIRDYPLIADFDIFPSTIDSESYCRFITVICSLVLCSASPIADSCNTPEGLRIVLVATLSAGILVCLHARCIRIFSTTWLMNHKFDNFFT